MRKVFSTVVLFFTLFVISAQTLQDAQREIDNESYFKAKQILFKLMKDPAANKADVAYYLGNAYLKSDDADSAKIFYKMVWHPDTRTALGYVASGRLALLAKNMTEAKTSFDGALKTTKYKNADIYYEIGDAYFRPTITDLAAAISKFEEGYNLNSKNCVLMMALGDAYLEKSSTDNTMGGKAMNMYEAADRECKANPQAKIRIGRLSMRGQMYDQAIKSFNDALQLDQSYPVIYKELGNAYYYTKQYDKFSSNYAKYIALSPGDIEAITSLLTMLIQNKEWDRALEEAAKGLKSDPNNYVFQRVQAIGNYELKRYKEAAEASKAFFSNSTRKEKDIDIIYAARIAAQVGDTATAFNYFRQALERDSSNCDLLSEFAKTLFLAKYDSEAIAQYITKKARCGSLSSLELYYLGRACFSVGDSLMADTTFAEFIMRNPTSPDGYYWRGYTNARYQILNADNYPALPYYQKYIELTASDPVKYKRNLTDAYFYVGLYFFYKVEDKAQAKSFFSKTLELDPANEYALEMMKQF